MAHSASITDVSNSVKIHYLLAHGTGDDNDYILVPFVNTAHSIDMFTAPQICNYGLKIYTAITELKDVSIAKYAALLSSIIKGKIKIWAICTQNGVHVN